ncbi:MAG: pilus motility taxis protein HmpF [Cyanobacteria bacterium P01_A01_bin.105]
MLYLAEVQKKSGVFGSGKAELKLIACQRSEQNWSAVPNDDVIPAPDDATYGAGALVMVELSGNRQIQRHYEAGRSLVSILQNFSSLSKKFKTQEDEIEQWKQSLTFQSQALNQRELEIETRQEELEQAEADLEKLQTEKDEIDQARTELGSLRQEYDRRNSELEGAWAHLNGELQKFEERQSDVQATAGLDASQTQQIQDSLGRLTSTVTPIDDLRQQLTTLQTLTAEQQGGLDESWQVLEQTRQAVTGQTTAVEQQQQALDQLWQGWQSLHTEASELKISLKREQALLTHKDHRNQLLADQLQQQNRLYKQLYALLNTGDQVRLSKRVDVAQLEAMPLDGLESTVSNLAQDLEKMSRFVSDQEEELRFQQEAIDEVKGKIEAANDFDQLQLETELDEEQDRYRMLNETLVGQRRNLAEREEVLEQHRAVLQRRQGLATEEEKVDAAGLEPVLEGIDAARQQLEQDIQALNDEIGSIKAKVEALKPQVEEKSAAIEAKQGEIRQAEADLVEKKAIAVEGQQTVSLYESTLQPIQDRLSTMKEAAERLMALTNQFQEANDYQLQAIAEMQQTVQSLTADTMAMAS